MLAYTGLETVANLAEETASRGATSRAASSPAIGLVVVIYVAIALVALSAFPAHGGTTALGTDWLRAPLMGIVDALGGHLPDGLGDALRVYVGLTGALDPARRRHDVDLGLHAARPLARRARPAAARVRPAEPAHARLAAGDRLARR